MSAVSLLPNIILSLRSHCCPDDYPTDLCVCAVLLLGLLTHIPPAQSPCIQDHRERGREMSVWSVCMHTVVFYVRAECVTLLACIKYRA